jgi:hypothetical protein
MTGANVIPPMTHELSSGWDQPSTSRILLDDTHALMTTETFKELKEYSATQPTGAYEGKMWKRHNGVFDHEFLARGGKPTWLLCWFDVSSKGPDWVSTKSRQILLVDADINNFK